MSKKWRPFKTLKLSPSQQQVFYVSLQNNQAFPNDQHPIVAVNVTSKLLPSMDASTWAQDRSFSPSYELIRDER